MGGWLSLFGALASFIEKISAYFQEKQLLEAGRGQANAAVLEKDNADVQAAVEAKADAVGNIVRFPDQLRDDDGFRRPD